MIEFINKLCTRILELIVIIPMFFTCLVLTIFAFLLYPFKHIRYWFGEQLDLTKEIPNTKYNKVEISLTHSHGGINYFDNSIQKAGYYLHFRPMTVSKSDSGYEVVSFAMFDKPEYSYKINIYNKYRLNKKKMEELWKIVENNMDKIFEAWETLTPMNVYKLLNNLFSQYMNRGDC